MTALLVANDGGHVTQLWKLAPRLDVDADRVWVTPRTPQTVSMLADEEVIWVERGPSRDARAAAKVAVAVRDRLRRRWADISSAVSTGSSLAVAVLPQARAHGVPTFYIESATRAQGPSLSGRILAQLRGTRLYTQNPSWADRRWTFRGSVFDGYRVDPLVSPQPVRRAVVSLGTSERYQFRSLVEHLIQQFPADVEVLWQTGHTDVSDLPIEGRPFVAAKEWNAAVAEADVVIAHAGTGVVLTSLEAGKLPVVVPRRASFQEHVDDHQEQIGRLLADNGLAVVRAVTDLTWEDVLAASAHEVHRQTPPRFRW